MRLVNKNDVFLIAFIIVAATVMAIVAKAASTTAATAAATIAATTAATTAAAPVAATDNSMDAATDNLMDAATDNSMDAATDNSMDAATDNSTDVPTDNSTDVPTDNSADVATTTLTAVFIVDGEVVLETPLSEDSEFSIRNENRYNTVRIESGQVFVVDASCPDGICIRQGKIPAGNNMIICMPNRLIIKTRMGNDAGLSSDPKPLAPPVEDGEGKSGLTKGSVDIDRLLDNLDAISE